MGRSLLMGQTGPEGINVRTCCWSGIQHHSALKERRKHGLDWYSWRQNILT